MNGCPYRKGLPPLPARMQHLPLDKRGYPVPFFVEWINGEPDFRVMSQSSFTKAVKFRRCWLCGDVLGSNLVFVVGPMCVVNRTSGEPPCHKECAEYAAISCPFLTLPKSKRNESGLPEEVTFNEGALRHNPGVTALYFTRDYRLFSDGNKGVLIRMGEPLRVDWYTEAHRASRTEVLAAFERGLPALRNLAAEEGCGAPAELASYEQRAMSWVPA